MTNLFDSNDFEVVLNVREQEFSLGVEEDVLELGSLVWDLSQEEADDLYGCVGNLLALIEEEWKKSSLKSEYMPAYCALMASVVFIKASLDCANLEKSLGS